METMKARADDRVASPRPSNPDVAYVNPGAPVPAAPQYPGVAYEATVPATLDLAERARLSVNALTESLDPDFDYELYWIVDLLAAEPAMYHTADDHVQDKFFQALPLCRTACGSEQNLDVEHALMHTYLKKQGPDGLIYIPFAGRPWGRPAGPHPWAGIDELPTGDHWASLIMTGRVLGAFSIYALKDPSGPWREAAFRLVEGLRRVCVETEDVAYFASNFWEPGKQFERPERPPLGFRAAVLGWAAQGLAQCHKSLGNEDALALAHKLIRYVFRDSGYFGPKGEFTEEWPDRPEMGQWIIHFHAHTSQILAALDVVQATGDEWLIERVLQAYDYALNQGDSLLGFFPEYLTYRGGMYGHGPCTSELCEVADMVGVAVKLAHLGIDKWDDVDRWSRNLLTEGQLTDIGWLSDGHREPIDRDKQPLSVGDWEDPDGKRGTTERVAERVLGSFSGWPGPNDLVQGENWSIMHCCTGNGARAIYYVWESILTHAEGRLRVNLLLNRASQWADIDSHLPFTGRVDVHVKSSVDLEIRIPEWVSPGQAAVTVNGAARDLDYDGRYARVGPVATGDEVVFSVPLFEVTHQIYVEKHPFTVVRRGNEVVWIDPPGHNRPLFQRGHYRSGETLYTRVTRFVPDEEIRWA